MNGLGFRSALELCYGDVSVNDGHLDIGTIQSVSVSNICGIEIIRKISATPAFTFTPSPALTTTQTSSYTCTLTVTSSFTETATLTATPSETAIESPVFTETATLTSSPTATRTSTPIDGNLEIAGHYVFPNPSDGKGTGLSIELTGNADELDISVYTAGFRKIQQAVFGPKNAGLHTCNLIFNSLLGNGIYYYLIRASGGAKTIHRTGILVVIRE
jgi:hypothetical protein